MIYIKDYSDLSSHGAVRWNFSSMIGQMVTIHIPGGKFRGIVLNDKPHSVALIHCDNAKITVIDKAHITAFDL